MNNEITFRDCSDVAELLGVPIVFNGGIPRIKEGA